MLLLFLLLLLLLLFPSISTTSTSITIVIIVLKFSVTTIINMTIFPFITLQVVLSPLTKNQKVKCVTALFRLVACHVEEPL